ncbi:MAG: GerMN domain-containing protein [Acidimicrobiia bacterium]|nr:GerMN domain-containing protein [Acidimicrobiia bacterium]
MPRHLLFGLICLLLISLAGVSYYYDLQQRIQELVRPSPEPVPYLAVPPTVSPTSPLRMVKLFFPSSRQENRLEGEMRGIRSAQLPSDVAKQVLSELIGGSQEGRLPALPPGTRLHELFLTKRGLAVVDLSQEASLNHPGGLTMELASIYCVVNSLTQNVPEIQQVQVLIEGVEAETLAGHIDLSRPFTEDVSMVEGNQPATLSGSQ